MEERRRIQLSRTRNIGESLRLPELGRLVFQLVIGHSLAKKGECWDFIRKDSKIVLYTAAVDMLKLTIEPGYKRVVILDESLNDFFQTLSEVKIPIFCNNKKYAVLDGTSYIIHVKSGRFDEIKIQWSSKPPEEWLEFADLVLNFIKILKNSSNLTTDDLNF